jgi:hypothetical protein
MANAFCDDMRTAGIKTSVERFLAEFRESPVRYRAMVTEHFAGTIPNEVTGILNSFAEHVSQVRRYDTENLYHLPQSAGDGAHLAAIMAAATAEVRALNDILGL